MVYWTETDNIELKLSVLDFQIYQPHKKAPKYFIAVLVTNKMLTIVWKVSD